VALNTIKPNQTKPFLASDLYTLRLYKLKARNVKLNIFFLAPEYLLYYGT
jgi:hypothetical protein